MVRLFGFILHRAGERVAQESGLQPSLLWHRRGEELQCLRVCLVPVFTASVQLDVTWLGLVSLKPFRAASQLQSPSYTFKYSLFQRLRKLGTKHLDVCIGGSKFEVGGPSLPEPVPRILAHSRYSGWDAALGTGTEGLKEQDSMQFSSSSRLILNH